MGAAMDHFGRPCVSQISKSKSKRKRKPWLPEKKDVFVNLEREMEWDTSLDPQYISNVSYDCTLAYPDVVGESNEAFNDFDDSHIQDLAAQGPDQHVRHSNWAPGPVPGRTSVQTVALSEEENNYKNTSRIRTETNFKQTSGDTYLCEEPEPSSLRHHRDNSVVICQDNLRRTTSERVLWKQSVNQANTENQILGKTRKHGQVTLTSSYSSDSEHVTCGQTKDTNRGGSTTLKNVRACPTIRQPLTSYKPGRGLLRQRKGKLSDSDCTGELNHDSSSGVASDTPSYFQRSSMATFKGDSGSDCVMSSDRSSGSASSVHQILKQRNDFHQGRTPPTSLSQYTRRPFTSSTPNLHSNTPISRTQRQGSVSSPLSVANQDGRQIREHNKDKLWASLKSKHPHLVPYFSYLSDNVIIRILSHLPSNQLIQCACVCKRWYGLAWDLSLWRTIQINSEAINVDRAVKYLTKRLSYETPGVCAIMEKINLNGCDKLTNRGLRTIARRCSELRHLEVKYCANISNPALFDVVSYCTNLEYLDVTGCPCITSVSLTEAILAQNSPKHMTQIYLRYLDMTDCYALEDDGLKTISAYCSQLQFIYLRRCVRITDLGIQYIANNCCFLREFSISDCKKITDFALKELSKLESNLRYLSLAKCDKISDIGVKYVANFCVKLRYMNLRGCEAVSDDSLEFLAQNCPRLRSLDVGKCDVTDDGLEGIAENCPQLRKLSVKSCDAVTDVGIKMVANHCRGLQQLNIQDCNVTVDAYRTVKKFCKKCIIEHTNPGFY